MAVFINRSLLNLKGARGGGGGETKYHKTRKQTLFSKTMRRQDEFKANQVAKRNVKLTELTRRSVSEHLVGMLCKRRRTQNHFCFS